MTATSILAGVLVVAFAAAVGLHYLWDQTDQLTPHVVIAVISVALLATIAALDTKHRRWHYLITAIVGVIVALNLTLVISLDRPFAGAAKVSDSAYREGVPTAVLNCATRTAP